MSTVTPTWIRWLDRLDRRIVYLLVMLSLLIPILLNKSLKMVELKSARLFYDAVEKLEPRDDQIVLIAMDWSAATRAENEPQTEAVVEHLLRRKVHFALLSTDPMSTPFLINLPEKVAARLKERTGQTCEYGKDWVNLGYRPGQAPGPTELSRGVPR